MVLETAIKIERQVKRKLELLDFVEKRDTYNDIIKKLLAQRENMIMQKEHKAKKVTKRIIKWNE